MNPDRSSSLPSPALRRRRLLAGSAAAALAVALMAPTSAYAQAFDGTPTVQGGNAFRSPTGPGQEVIAITTPSAVINWNRGRSSIGDPWVFLPAGNQAIFVGQPGFAVLNRLIPNAGETVIMDGTVLGRVANANNQPTNVRTGTIAFYTPNGLLIGANSLFDVGSLILTTLNPAFNAADGTFITAGQVNFQTAPNTASFVTIAAGARVNAPDEGSFVILSAPQVTQGGSVRVNGSAAYVAAHSAFITHDAGAFDILVTEGTALPTPLVHTGSTTGPASTGGADVHQIAMTAVSEDQAITALVGGTVGYDAPISATVENGAIIISAEVRGSQPDQDPQAGLQLTDGTFTSDVTAQSSHNASATGNINFQQDLTLAGARTTRVTANAGQTIQVGGNLVATSASSVATIAGNDRTGGDVQVRAANGGRIQVAGNASVLANGVGIFNGDSNRIGSGTGGLAALEADGGTITVGGNLSVQADGRTVAAPVTPVGGGAGTGGTSRIFASNNGSITVMGGMRSSAVGIASATTGNDPVSPTGTGGTASIGTSSGGQITANGPTLVEALGMGGTVLGNGRTGGAGTGGTGRVEANGGRISLNGGLGMDSRGIGETAPNGGSGAGGGATVQASNGGRITAAQSTLDARGLGGNASQTGGSGGNATGGTVTVRAIGGAAGGALALGNLDLFALAVGGNGGPGLGGPTPTPAGAGGTARGGSIEATADADSGDLAAGDVRADATARGGAGGAPGAGQAAGPGGTATGGNVLAGVRAGPAAGNAGRASFTRLDLNAGAVGGNGGIGATATGGAVELRSTGGTIGVTGATLLGASALGGTGRAGGAAQGGSAGINATGGVVTLGAGISAQASATGGATSADGVSAGNGRGGSATIGVAGAGAQVRVTGAVSLDASGSGGGSLATVPVAGQVAGAGFGGTSGIFARNGALFSATGATILNSDGLGGLAETAGGGTGGTATVEADGAGSSVSLGNAYVHADGQAATGTGPAAVGGGASTGGTAAIRAGAGGTVALGNVAITAVAPPFPTSALVSAQARQGGAYSGARGHAAQAGTATISAAGGTITSGLGAQVNGSAFGGAGAGNAGGGNATGGTAAMLASGNGSITVAGRSTVAASATGGNGAGSGNGGDAVAGTARLSANAGSIQVQGAGGSSVEALAFGGSGRVGGAGRGGGAELSASGGTGSVTVAGATSVLSDGTGGAGVTAGGAATGGAALVSANSSVQLGSLTLGARATGGGASGAGGAGGTAQGGTATLNAGAGSTIQAGATGANILTAAATGGLGTTGGNSNGGAVNVTVAPGGQVTLSNATTMTVSAGLNLATGFLPATGNAGTINVQSDGVTNFGALTARASVVGAETGNGGAIAIGGTGTVNYQSADLEARGVGLTAGTGAIQLRNMVGAAGTSTLAAAAGGPLTVNAVSGGNVTLSSVSGPLDATGVTAGQSVSATTQNGTLTAANVTAGQNVTATTGTGTLAAANVNAGGAVSLASTGGAVSATNVAGGQSISVATPRSAILAGTIAAPTIQVASADIDVQAGAAVGAAGGNVTLIVQPTANQTVIGGTAQGAGYTLDAAEAGRLRAANLIISAPANGANPARAPDVAVRDVTFDGGRVTSLTLSTPGIVQVEGALLMSNAGAGNRILLGSGAGAQRIQLLTPGGSVRLHGAGGAPAGTVQIAAQDIWVADQGLMIQLLADRNFAGRNSALLTPAGVSAPRGYVEGFDVLLQPGSSLLVQNSGNRTDFGGITVGNSLTINAGGQVGPGDVYAFGRRLRPDGTSSFGIPYFFEVSFQGTYTDASAFNTCIINTRACPGAPTAPPGSGIQEPVDPAPGRVPPLFAGGELIDQAFLNEDLIEEPVTSGGDSSAWTQTGDGEDEEDDEEEEEQVIQPPATPAAAQKPGGGRR